LESQTDRTCKHIDIAKNRGRRTRGLVVLGVGSANNLRSEKKENTWQQTERLEGTIGRLGNGGGSGVKKEVCCGMRFWFA